MQHLLQILKIIYYGISKYLYGISKYLYRMWQNFPEGKVSHLDCKMLIHSKTSIYIAS